MKGCLVIVPVFNERKTISLIIGELRKLSIDILVIDDFSSDYGCSSLQEKYSIHVIRNKFNIGYEKSLNKGLNFAEKYNYKYVITFDGDGEHLVESVPYIINLLEKGYHIVIGARQRKNRFSEKILHYVFLLLFKISDPLSGLKGYSIKELKNKGINTSFEASGTRALIKAIKKNLKICSIPIKTNSRIGESRYGYGIKLDIKILKNVISEFL